jgi:hypothetical protein
MKEVRPCLQEDSKTVVMRLGSSSNMETILSKVDGAGRREMRYYLESGPHIPDVMRVVPHDRYVYSKLSKLTSSKICLYLSRGPQMPRQPVQRA